MDEIIEPLPVGYAVIQAGQVADIVKGQSQPANSLPVYENRPSYNSAYETLVRDGYTIEAGKVMAQFSVELKPSALETLRKIKVNQVKEKGWLLAKVIYPSANSFDMLSIFQDFILSVKPDSRQLVGNVILAKQIYDAGMNAIQTIQTMTDIEALEAFDTEGIYDGL